MTTHMPFDETVGAAVEVYNLERSLHDLDTEALSAAISLANRKHEEIVVTHIIEILDHIGEDMKGHFGSREVDGNIALKFAAAKIRDELPRRTVTSDYHPVAGDKVEVILIGDVSLEQEECENCGTPHDVGVWSLKTGTGREHFFDRKDSGNTRVRVLLHDVPGDDEEDDDKAAR